jgi:hypothetical protein
LKDLRQLRDQISQSIDEISAQPRREIDIAADFDGRPDLVAEVLRTRGNPDSGKWKQLQRIYCSPEHCSECPHGEFWYRYTRNRKKKTLKSTYIGKPGLSQDELQHLNEQRRPIVAFVEVVKPKLKGRDLGERDH